MTTPRITLFGEVLYDCFPGGEQVLGGAPFNVAWHLQALGDAPRFISRVGADPLGERILQAMRDWGMGTESMEIDPDHPTGKVAVQLIDGEPHYDIVPDSAYDFITADAVPALTQNDLLYHGTLGLRNPVARRALDRLIAAGAPKIFLDVNLRAPWWQRDEVLAWLQRATWVKMNQDELALFSAPGETPQAAMARLQQDYELEQLLVTRGAEGVLLRTVDGSVHSLKPPRAEHIVDTVGAGDAYSAVYLHGLAAGWPVDQLLATAQDFANKIIAMRGATAADPALYQHLTTA
nr:carbohydrate kinase [uncultured Desulfuromonas sp.]